MKIAALFLLLIAISATTIREQVIESQIIDLMKAISGKTVAMLTNPTSVDGKMTPLFQRIIDLSSQYNATLKCFFAPQHGLRGNHQDGAGDQDYIDPQTNIQVYSLYGVRKAPTDAQLSGIDAFIYDIQDVGARYYTFMWTLTYAIQACAKNKVEVIVFDRPNPLGRKVEGCPSKIDAGDVGRLLPGQYFTIPQRYGLTVGEFILYLRPYLAFFNYTVIKMSSWYYLEENQWVLSSPNIPTLDTVLVYSGLGLIEGTSVSSGRGSTKPFHITGYPNVTSKDIITYFQEKAAATGYGQTFWVRENYFIPTFNKYTGIVCGGAEIHLIDREKYDSVKVALHMIKAYLSAVKDGSMKISSGFDRMFGIVGSYLNIQNKSVQSMLDNCKDQREQYLQLVQKIYLYDIPKRIQMM